MIDNKYIDDVITQVSIEEVCMDAGVVFTKTQGHRKWACCPFHSEKTPSFCVDIATNKWHCFGACQTGGNVISFLMKAENIPFPLAVKKLLHNKLNIDIEDKEYLITDEEKERLLTEDIEKQFAELNENIEQRSGEYRDNFRVLVRVERTLRTLEKMANSGSSDTVKMSATTKLMDFQEQQLAILERLMNLEKAQKIESLTRRFFNEIRKYSDLQNIADRYLELLKDID